MELVALVILVELHVEVPFATTEVAGPIRVI